MSGLENRRRHRIKLRKTDLQCGTEERKRPMCDGENGGHCAGHVEPRQNKIISSRNPKLTHIMCAHILCS